MSEECISIFDYELRAWKQNCEVVLQNNILLLFRIMSSFLIMFLFLLTLGRRATIIRKLRKINFLVSLPCFFLRNIILLSYLAATFLNRHVFGKRNFTIKFWISVKAPRLPNGAMLRERVRNLILGHQGPANLGPICSCYRVYYKLIFIILT